MVALIPKASLQSANIDTAEKAIVFAGLVLRAALVGSDNSNAADLNAVITVQAVSETQGNLNLELYLPYSAYLLNLNGGNLLDSLEEYSSNSSTLEVDLNLNSIPSTSGLMLPDYDEATINTFEKYLLFYSKVLWLSLTNKTSDVIQLTLLGNQDVSQVLVSANFPLDLNRWLVGGNYLNSIAVTVESYVDPNVTEIDYSLFTESTNYFSYFFVGDFFGSETFFTAEQLGLVDSIYLDIYYTDELAVEEAFFDAYIYLNGEEIFPLDYYDYGDGTVELVFDTTNNPILLTPGDELALDFSSDYELEQVDVNTYILEIPAPQP